MRIFLVLSVLLAPLVCRGESVITTVAGPSSTISTGAFFGDGGPATKAEFRNPTAIKVDAAGNLYIADQGNYRIRKVDTAGIVNTVAGNGTLLYSGDGGPATSAGVSPSQIGGGGLAIDAPGNLYISDTGISFRIRRVDTAGIITTFAGNGFPIASGDGGPATSAGLARPAGLAFDSAGNLFIADIGSARVRKVNTSGIITTAAGNGNLGFSGDGGPATSATFNAPTAVAVDSAGNLYIADSTAHRIRKVDTSGVIRTIAGNGTPGFSGDGGPATSAQLFGPTGIAVDSAGSVFIADSANRRVRKIDAAGIIATVVGSGRAGFGGDGGPPANADLGNPSDVALDSAGNLYIADSFNHRVRKVTGIAAPGGSSGVTPVVAAAVNGASFAAGQALAPGLLASLFGTGLAASAAVASTVPLPVSLAGVSVSVGGIPAPLFFVSPGQINFQVPWNIQAGTADVAATVNGATSAVFRANIGLVSPGIFTAQSGQAIAINPDGSLAGPRDSIPGFPTHPAKVGDTIIILATGLSLVTPPIATGAASSDTLRRTIVSPTVLIGGVPARVDFSGLSPQFVAVYQLNVVVPNVPAGVVSLQLEIGGIRTSDKVTMAVAP